MFFIYIENKLVSIPFHKNHRNCKEKKKKGHFCQLITSSSQSFDIYFRWLNFLRSADVLIPRACQKGLNECRWFHYLKTMKEFSPESTHKCLNLIHLAWGSALFITCSRWKICPQGSVLIECWLNDARCSLFPLLSRVINLQMVGANPKSLPGNEQNDSGGAIHPSFNCITVPGPHLQGTLNHL